MGNRRDYVREQLKSGTPVLGTSLQEGILLLGVGSGQSKVFELFDRHAMAGLGHPADLEKIRQAAIDAAHMESFTRAPEDVSLRRLVSFGLSGQLKSNFEQIFSAPFLIELLLAELGSSPKEDLFFRLHFDGSFQSQNGGIVVCASQNDQEQAAQQWLQQATHGKMNRRDAADLLLQAWWCLSRQKSFDGSLPAESERQKGWRKATEDKIVEIGWLSRGASRQAKYDSLTLDSLKL